MKKYLHGLTIIINIILFISVYFAFTEKDVSDIYHCFGFSDNKVTKYVEFEPSMNQESDDEFFKKLQRIADENQVDFIFSNMDYEKMSFEIYVLSNQDVANRMNLETTKHFSFQNGNKQEYENGKNFYLLNPNVNVKILPLSRMSEKYPLSKSYKIIAEDEFALNQAIMKLEKDYQDHIIGINDYVSERYDLESEISNKFRLLFTVSMFSFLMILFYIVSNEQKKTAILKLNGVSSFRCMVFLFLKTLLIDMVLAFMTLSFLFMIVVGNVNSRTIPMIQQLMSGYMLQVGLFVLVVFLFVLLLHFEKLPDLIKGKNYHFFLMNCNYVIKLLMLILLFPLCLSYFNKISQDMQIVQYLKRHEKYYEDVVSVYNFKSTVPQINYDPTWFFADPDNETLKLYADVYDSLNAGGAVLCRPNYVELSNQKQYIGIEVNGHYLDWNKIMDADGNQLKLDTDGEIVYLLADRHHLEEVEKNMKSFYQFQSEVQMIEVSDQNQFIYYSFIEMNDQLPKVAIVYSDHAKRFDKSFLNHVYIKNYSVEETENILSEYHLNGQIEYREVKESALDIYLRIKDQLLLNGLVMLALFMLLVYQIIQFIYFYYQSFKQQIYVKKIMGYASSRLFLPILGESLFAYLILFGLNHQNIKEMLISVFVMILLEAICFWIYDKAFERKDVFKRREAS